MPIYEYRCEHGHTFEVMQRMSDDPVEACEACSAPVEKVFRPVAVHFKGSGFYNTDYGTRKRSRELKEAAEGNGKAKGDSGSKSSSDSKAGSDSGAGTGSGSESNSSGSKPSAPAKAASSSS